MGPECQPSSRGHSDPGPRGHPGDDRKTMADIDWPSWLLEPYHKVWVTLHMLGTGPRGQAPLVDQGPTWVQGPGPRPYHPQHPQWAPGPQPLLHTYRVPSHRSHHEPLHFKDIFYYICIIQALSHRQKTRKLTKQTQKKISESYKN